MLSGCVLNPQILVRREHCRWAAEQPLEEGTISHRHQEICSPQQVGQWAQALLHQFAGPSPLRDEAVTGTLRSHCVHTVHTMFTMHTVRTLYTLCTLHHPETLKWAYFGNHLSVCNEPKNRCASLQNTRVILHNMIACRRLIKGVIFGGPENHK